jgi:putative N6-adenine-specific DNA methylase
MIVPPGFEKLALSELYFKQAISSDLDSSHIRILKGGIELDLDLDAGLQLNVKSHLATRVLVRIEKFRCRDFPKLFKKTQGIDWSKWLKGPFEVSVSAHRSRLMNKKRIESTVGEAIEKQSKNKLKRSVDDSILAQTVYVRFDNDEVELSLDTSGEALFKRGYKHLEATAPIRENLAAGLFWALYEKAGRPKDIAVCDLMCGSGTLLTEAGIFFETNQAAESTKLKIFGFDKDNDAVQIAKKNISNVSLQKVSQVTAIDFLEADGMQQIKAQLSRQAPFQIGISNPPYGMRLKWPRPPQEFYRALVEAYRAAGCQIFGFIVPRSALKSVPRPIESFPFKNGGIDVVFNIYEN